MSIENPEQEQAEGAVPAAAAPAPSATPAAPAVDPIAAALSEYGIDTTGFDDPREAIGELVNYANEYRQNQAYVDYGRQVAGNWDKYQEFVSQPRPELTEPVQKPSWDWAPPEVDRENINRFCELDPSTGRFRLRETAHPNLGRYADEANRYLDWREQAENRIYTDFPGTVKEIFQTSLPDLMPTLQENLDQLINQRFESLYEQRQQRAKADSEFASVQDKLFAKSESGEWLRDPRTNEFVLTPRGKYFQQQYAREIARRGTTEEQAKAAALEQLRIAEGFSFFDSTQGASPTPTPSPQEQAEANRQTFLEEAISGVRPGMNRDGTYSTSASEPPQSPRRVPTAHELAEETIREMGS